MNPEMPSSIWAIRDFGWDDCSYTWNDEPVECPRTGRQPTEYIRAETWRDFDKERPAEEGIQVWAHTVGLGPHPSILEPSVILDFSNDSARVQVLKTYRSLDGTIRINCSAAQRVTHWMPYHVPAPPEVKS